METAASTSEQASSSSGQQRQQAGADVCEVRAAITSASISNSSGSTGIRPPYQPAAALSPRVKSFTGCAGMAHTSFFHGFMDDFNTKDLE